MIVSSSIRFVFYSSFYGHCCVKRSLQCIQTVEHSADGQGKIHLVGYCALAPSLVILVAGYCER